MQQHSLGIVSKTAYKTKGRSRNGGGGTYFVKIVKLAGFYTKRYWLEIAGPFPPKPPLPPIIIDKLLILSINYLSLSL